MQMLEKTHYTELVAEAGLTVGNPNQPRVMCCVINKQGLKSILPPPSATTNNS